MQQNTVSPATQGRTKFIIGGLLIIAAIVYLIVSSTQASTQYFLTVEELVNRPEMANRDVRVSGVVLGDTIQYDADTLDLRFTVASIPADQKDIDAQGGLALVLHNAALDSSLPRIPVIYNGVMPDLLKNEAQAIMTGQMDDNGVFHAEELLLKCPTRYEEAVPEQANTSN
ncbi:MAG: cytochrome c maturation protein CcmE [Anaerolineae bacterium]|jgi:cytochrome c-type biogenesis protein CcmE|nr:cytochrome c maturation protein CcmE [Anaerolineae bacterium]